MTFIRRKRAAEFKTVSGEEVESSSKKSKVETDLQALHLPAPLLAMYHDQVLNHKLKQQVDILVIQICIFMHHNTVY
ncbi:hypothetical protein EON65_19715 [archaeon]|nr:MAG: hypothetical protein EON65_19715 [archaeon]